MTNSRNVNEPSPNMDRLPRYQATRADRSPQSEAMMPSDLGDNRRVVLDHLGGRYGRHFINNWAFLRFAQEQGLDLDLTTPPKRPDSKESFRTRAILDRPESGR
ncbi:MAG: hypothetical protein ACLQIB_09275 [Isosphaeraceae bacterium]